MSTRAPKNGMRPVHPGEVLREDYLKPLRMSANALAKALRVPASRINDIVLERRGVSVDTAMRLVRYFGGDVQDLAEPADCLRSEGCAENHRRKDRERYRTDGGIGRSGSQSADAPRA